MSTWSFGRRRLSGPAPTATLIENNHPRDRRVWPPGGSTRPHCTARKCLTLVLVLAAMRVPGRALAAEPSADRRIRQLEETMRRTQEELESLKHQLEQQKALEHATNKQVEENQETQAKTAQAVKGIELPDWAKRASVFGDVRYRHEGFYHQPHVKGADATARNRERIRGRLGVRFAFSDELSATIRGASGNINDPISTNETLTGNWNRKSFNLDWAYLTFTPGKSFGIRPGLVSNTMGKFPNPIFRADEMVFDEDLSVEGSSQTFQLLDKPRGNLDQVKLHALEWVLDEVSNKQDAWMFGGQVNPTAHLGAVQFEGGIGQYWWLNPNQIAEALSRNTTAFTASGAPVANSNFNSSLVNTNLLVTQNVQPPTPKGGKKPAAFNAITGYQSGFNQSNLTLAGTIPNVWGAQPLRIWADYVYNWQAVNDAAHGWTAGLRLGQTKVKDDWSVYSLYEHLDQEAAISAFTWSDFGNGGTNQEGPVVGVDYQLLNPLTVSARSYFTNLIDRPAQTSNPTQTRVQLDVQVKF